MVYFPSITTSINVHRISVDSFWWNSRARGASPLLRRPTTSHHATTLSALGHPELASATHSTVHQSGGCLGNPCWPSGSGSAYGRSAWTIHLQRRSWQHDCPWTRGSWSRRNSPLILLICWPSAVRHNAGACFIQFIFLPRTATNSDRGAALESNPHSRGPPL